MGINWINPVLCVWTWPKWMIKESDSSGKEWLPVMFPQTARLKEPSASFLLPVLSALQVGKVATQSCVPETIWISTLTENRKKTISFQLTRIIYWHNFWTLSIDNMNINYCNFLYISRNRYRKIYPAICSMQTYFYCPYKIILQSYSPIKK